MFEEIEKARKKAEGKRARQKKDDEQLMKDREAKAMSANKGELVECDICAEDRPPNHMASCNAKDKHTYCFLCVKTHVETIIGDGKHAAVCMTADCKGHYPRQVLEELLDKALVSRMERLQQNAELKGVKGIEECPFCNFKAFCETPSKFDCQNPECLMSSCLKCKAETHSGLSCAAYAKKKKESKGESKGMRLRHLVEEAMTEALLRRCPQCKTPFTKDMGCNKMVCPACGMMSCYVCGAPRISVSHFGVGGCPQFEATEARHDAEVKKAEKAAIEKVKRENPGVTDDDLKFAMSDKVKQDDKRRLAKDSRALRGEDWHFGMPVEDGDEDIEGDMFMQEMMGNRMMRRPRGMGMQRPRFDDGWEDGFRMQMDRDRGLFGDRALLGRHFRGQQGGGFGDMRERQVNAARVDLMRQQEVIFNQAVDGQLRGFAARRGRNIPNIRQARLPATAATPAEAARAAALARERRWF